ncbi:MAG: sugar ABC transporter permease [Deinococcota bacterium]
MQSRLSRTSQQSSRPSFRVSLTTREAIWAYIFLTVPLVFFVFLRIWPAFQSFWLSMFTWHVNPAERDFVGFDYYQELIRTPKFRRALLNTLLYTAIIVPVQLVLGLGIASLLQLANKRFRGLFRAIYFAPYITPGVAVAWVWSWMYSYNYGIFNTLIIEWGIFWEARGINFLTVDPIRFLGDPDIALYSVAALIIWQQLGFQVVIFLAGLQGIPKMYYEAARIDGAGGGQLFWNITLPLLNPVLVFSVVISTIYSLQLFDQVVNINFADQGGPLDSTLTIALYMYQEAFSRFRMGYAAAITVVLFLLILTVTLIQLKFASKRVEY